MPGLAWKMTIERNRGEQRQGSHKRLARRIINKISQILICCSILLSPTLSFLCLSLFPSLPGSARLISGKWHKAPVISGVMMFCPDQSRSQSRRHGGRLSMSGSRSLAKNTEPRLADRENWKLCIYLKCVLWECDREW